MSVYCVLVWKYELRVCGQSRGKSFYSNYILYFSCHIKVVVKCWFLTKITGKSLLSSSTQLWWNAVNEAHKCTIDSNKHTTHSLQIGQNLVHVHSPAAWTSCFVLIRTQQHCKVRLQGLWSNQWPLGIMRPYHLAWWPTHGACGHWFTL